MSTKKQVFLNKNGEVIQTNLAFDLSSYDLSGYTNRQNLVVDQTLPDVNVSYSETQSVPGADGTSGQTSRVSTKTVQVNPLTEQILTGTVNGFFETNEQVFQSTITPTIVNNYAVAGICLGTFIPSIGSIGVCGGIGVRAGKFKGTALDSAGQKAAGILLPPFTTSASTPYFMLEGWVYLESEPSNNYDPILVTRSADGVNASTNDSFRLEYDSGNNQFVFHFADSSNGSSGYNVSNLNVCPVDGATLNQWHHFAVMWGRTGGATACMAYWNGAFYGSIAVTGHLRNSTSPVMVGSGRSGDYPFKGWMEDVHMRMGGVSLALGDYALMGATAPVVYEQDYAGDYTVYLLSMNGPQDTSLFPVDNLCRVTGTISFRDESNGVIGTSLVCREDSDVLGLTLFDGVCGGFTASGGTAAYLFGYNSGGCMVVSSVQQIQGLSGNKDVRRNASDYTSYYLFGVTTMQGSTTNREDFPYLFAGGWSGGNTFSFLPIQSNVNWLRNLYDNIVVAGYTGNTVIGDYNGTQFNFITADVKNLYSDVVAYQSAVNQLRTSLNASVTGSSTHSGLRAVLGVSAHALRKIVPTVGQIGSVYVTPKAKISGTATPEGKNLPKQPQTPYVSGVEEIGGLGKK